MNLRWDTVERVFIAEFSQDFSGDLAAVKAAGFRPLGVPPPWIWHAPVPGIKALNRLRENRPASGLTITPEALAVYQPMAELDKQNAIVKAQLNEIKKKQKKEQKLKAQEAATTQVPEGKMWIGPEDLPPMPPFVSSHVISTPTPTLLCHTCSQPVYFYELQNPPTCLWCEIMLDKDRALVTG